MQQHNKIRKLLLDILSIIEELEKIIIHHNRDFIDFSSNFISVRAVERDLMIIGEAISQIRKIDSQIKFTEANQIIGLRNLIVHAYDSIDPAVLWRILIKNLPILKFEVHELNN